MLTQNPTSFDFAKYRIMINVDLVPMCNNTIEIYLISLQVVDNLCLTVDKPMACLSTYHLELVAMILLNLVHNL